MKEKLKKVLLFISNPRLLLCVAIAWLITNGWSYIFVTLGTLLNIGWMVAVGGAYLAFLWIPFTPEKIVTFTIAIALLRWWFPNDQKTLAVLKDGYARAKAAFVSWLRARKHKRSASADETAEQETPAAQDASAEQDVSVAQEAPDVQDEDDALDA